MTRENARKINPCEIWAKKRVKLKNFQKSSDFFLTKEKIKSIIKKIVRKGSALCEPNTNEQHPLQALLQRGVLRYTHRIQQSNQRRTVSTWYGASANDLAGSAGDRGLTQNTSIKKQWGADYAHVGTFRKFRAVARRRKRNEQGGKR